MTSFDELEAEFRAQEEIFAPPVLSRPAPSDSGLGRLLRRAIGVQEQLMDWVPEERARYTRLGAIVLATSTLAAVSMLTALTRVTDIPLPFLIPAGLLWGALIFAFDSWLIASTQGVRRFFSLAVFVPRLVISLLIGAVIAEPLILTVFGPSISTQVDHSRQEAATQYTARLKQCNSSALGAPSTDPRCTGYILNVQEKPRAISDQLTAVQQQRQSLQKQYDALNSTYAELNDRAQKECAGTAGPGLTGVLGEGGQCRRDRQDADNFKIDNQLDAKVATLAALATQETKLTASLSAAKATLAGDVDKAITAKTEEFVKAQGKVGLLDEDRALGELASQSTFVLVGSWLLRLLLIAVDTLPVLVKMIGGKTTYDGLVRGQLDMSYNLHQRAMELDEQRDASEFRIQIHATETRRRHAIEEIDEAARAKRSGKRAQQDAEIDRLAAQLRGDAPIPTL